MGSRMLRNNILQPNTSPEHIANRLDAVQELLAHPVKLDEVRRSLGPVTKLDFEAILSKLGKEASFEQKTTHLLQLRQMITATTVIGAGIGDSGKLLDSIKHVSKRREFALTRNYRMRRCRGWQDRSMRFCAPRRS